MRKFFVWSSAIVVAACASSHDGSSAPRDGGADEGDGGFDPDTAGIHAVGIALDPPTASVDVVDGDVSAASVTFTLSFVLVDGTKRATSGFCALDRNDLGSLDTLTFHASGSAGGAVTLSCKVGGFDASA